MMNWKNVKHLVQNEIRLELKNKHSIGAILLYVAATTFVVYLSFKTIDSPKVWNAIFWIMILFACINTISGSFKETLQQNAYLHTLIRAEELLLSKIIYNSLLLMAVCLLCLLFYSLFIGSFISNVLFFLMITLLGCLTLSVILTIAAGIAYKASGSTSLFSILSIPVIIPILILLITSSGNALSSSKFKTFIESEIYAGENANVKVKCISINNSTIFFSDDSDKTREINFKPSKIQKGQYYILTGIYQEKINQFVVQRISPFDNSIQKNDFIKVSSIALICILILGIGTVIFPKFWLE